MAFPYVPDIPRHVVLVEPVLRSVMNGPHLRYPQPVSLTAQLPWTSVARPWKISQPTRDISEVGQVFSHKNLVFK